MTRSFDRIGKAASALVAFFVGGWIGAAQASDAAAAHADRAALEAERAALEARVQGVRQALAEQPAGADASALDTIAQWMNWSNWGNWNRWPNWNNWANWFNR
jgi:hypothetical protein